MEFDEVYASECRRILILSTAAETSVEALDLEGKLRDVVFAERQIQPLYEGFDHRDDHC